MWGSLLALRAGKIPLDWCFLAGERDIAVFLNGRTAFLAGEKEAERLAIVRRTDLEICGGGKKHKNALAYPAVLSGSHVHQPLGQNCRLERALSGFS